ncbi:MAG: hypothetical protein NC320_01350 [Clostridium sp.]|nr:hypothetical protein [Clostridium sp.]MCM1547817.1 hypothetical protein [Ruminococcus sp.]
MKYLLSLITAMLFLLNSEIGFGGIENTIVNKSDNEFSAEIICDYDKYNDNIYHQAYLAVDLGTDTIMKDIGGSFGDTLLLCDIDGDHVEEIVVQQTKGISGGAGQYSSSIFKITNNEIKEIFNSDNIDKFDTGFYGKLKNGYELEIKNKFTGYITTHCLADNNKYSKAWFDENGVPTCNETVLLDSFKEFIPKDIDGDGIYELICMQYASLGGHSNYIGNAECCLKYDVQENKFKVVKAEFIPAYSK